MTYYIITTKYDNNKMFSFYTQYVLYVICSYVYKNTSDENENKKINID